MHLLPLSIFPAALVGQGVGREQHGDIFSNGPASRRPPLAGSSSITVRRGASGLKEGVGRLSELRHKTTEGSATKPAWDAVRMS